MKLFDAIREAKRIRSTSGTRYLSATSTEEPVDVLFLDPHWRITYEIKVKSDVTGPLDSIPDMHQRVRQAIAYEIFGEAIQDLLEIRNTIAREDIYRPVDDPALTKIHSLIQKMMGDE